MSTRRSFLKQAGSITIGFSILGPIACTTDNKDLALAEMPQPLTDPERIDSWIRLLEDGRIQVITGKMELGQGLSTAILQVAAEELNTSFNQLSLQLAETGVTPDEGITAGSRSMETSAMSVRQAAACLRETFFGLVVEEYETSVDNLEIENGNVLVKGVALPFTEILKSKNIEKAVFEPKELYGKTRRAFVGHPMHRPDLEKMVRGEAFYVQDLRFPGMVHARVIRTPAYNAVLAEVPEAEVADMPGFVKLVRNGTFLAVVAEKEFQAVQLQRALGGKVTWEVGEPLEQPEDIKAFIKSLPQDSNTDEDRGAYEEVAEGAAITHKASYSKPYIMHAANGPSCAVALFEEGVLHIWCHSQGVYPLRETIAKMVDLPLEKVHIKGVPGSGCYGHNPADDVAGEAALIAKEIPGKHVRLQWMRNEEHAWEPYGTAMVMEHEAVLSENGKIKGWNYELWSDAHSTRPTSGDPANLLPGRFLEPSFGTPGQGWRGGAIRNAPPIYTTNAFRLTSHIFQGPLRVSALRSLGAYANVFSIECFMDELAEKAGQDPFTFRLRHLEDKRAISCLGRLKLNVSEVSPEKGQGLGIGFARYKNSAAYCAVAALVEVTDGNPVVKKMWAVIDAGECINPDGLKNQTEGGMIQSASWTLKEAVKWNDTHISSIDWQSYPILRFQEIPKVEVEVVDRPETPPLGAGEAAQGPAAAAVVNAIYNATGVRVRDLPVGRVN
ncbi:xanthine dehydrogenase family protein molybdopterin-binding subunit [Robertkochia marina]|uniref:Xanthine dehydrogenase family protein molybdopterin-binding subunit n=1 Tax=Robertkochia marina TaxID=1227945 RepID=A0A4S3M3H4_9FLAO|nr:molybdopterin cofactor-binding domain-containing protein [Robertkochia marina]THD69249.1 xanthine dehydrogenase family protein molybdopterin-binding subunit [Robertkochia marina]TRZ47493.1 xanthine dehydrogenase family protein molybdopterin-binding subunit [Robertkochia marina]